MGDSSNLGNSFQTMSSKRHSMCSDIKHTNFVGHSRKHFSNVTREREHRKKVINGLRLLCNEDFQDILITAKDKKLIVAAATNNLELLKHLLQIGANPNTCDAMKRSPLHLSACAGYIDIVKCLVEHGADPNIRDIMNNTPLHLAACTSNVPVVIALLDAGTDVSSLNTNGMNPLQLAQSKLKLIKQLPSAAESEKLKSEVQLIGEMMHKCLKSDAGEIDALNQRLKNMNTREEVDNEIQTLLDNLTNLSLKKM